MDCYALLDSGNIAMHFARQLEKKSYYFEIVPTPCSIATTGCGYCMKLPHEYLDMLLKAAADNGIAIRAAYKLFPAGSKRRYEKIF